VEQALGDIKAHEVAMMTAMEAALKGLLDQLSPNSLEAQLASGGGISGLLKGKKARYWDIYEKMYAKISEQAETDFQELFGREFARAYQAQTERLK
jgi:type VI secretion system FHA domain protein